MANEINNHFVVGSSASATQHAADAKAPPDATKGPLSNPVDAETKADKAQAPAAMDSAKLEKVVDELNQHVLTVGRDLRFSVDRESGYTIIKVVDSETDETVRQIPLEEAIELAKFLRQTNDLSSTGLVEEA